MNVTRSTSIKNVLRVLVIMTMLTGVGKTLSFASNIDSAQIVDNEGNNVTVLDGKRCGDLIRNGIYSCKDDGVILKKVSPLISGKVVIPSYVTYDGRECEVIGIGENAFKDCSEITEVTIQAGIENIDDMAFARCTGLREIIIPDSVKSIGHYAFFVCTGLREITIPDSVTSIGEWAFYGCTGLRDLIVPDRVSIAMGTFSKTGLTRISIPDEARVEENAFAQCPMLRQVILPSNGKFINNNAFNGSDCVEFILRDNVDTIRDEAFKDCTYLTNIIIPEGVSSIGSRAFSGCAGLKEVTIPNSVTSIGAGAFRDCKNLENITIPNSVTEIGDFTFDGCEGLRHVCTPQRFADGGIFKCSAVQFEYI